MSVEQFLRIAVIGAGPVGLEAALYARFLGFHVDVYDGRQVAHHIRRWRHVQMFTPFALNRSILGLAALAAQDSAYQPPDDAALLTGGQFAERYLVPLAQTDLLADCVHPSVRVLAVGRDGLLKGELPGRAERTERPFRLLLRDGSGAERFALADVVIDASGTFANHNWLGRSGVPARGEQAAESSLEYCLPDVLGAQRQDYQGHHCLLVGSGYSAATTCVALCQLASEEPGTRVTWVTRSAGGKDPIALIPHDRLPARQQLARAANAYASEGTLVTHLAETSVEAMSPAATGDGFQVELVGKHAGTLSVDRIIGNVGYRPDNSLYAELQVHECYASGGPMKLAAALMGQNSADCLDQLACGPDTLQNPEPGFYILGSKSYGRSSNFLLSVGLEQVREVFTLIAGNADLNLYNNVRHLVP